MQDTQQGGQSRMSAKEWAGILVQIGCGVSVVLCVLFLLGLGTVFWTLWQAKRAGMAKIPEGQAIVKSIEAYRDATGLLPESLSDLVPAYTQAVPPGWEYERWSPALLPGQQKTEPDRRFFLTFWVRGGFVRYISEEGWSVTVRDSPPKVLGLDPKL